jgi:hypothetical protein
MHDPRRTQTTSATAPSPRIAAAGQPVVGFAVPGVATDAADPGCPERGGRVLSPVRIGSLLIRPHTGEQQERADLSKNLENPSRGEQIGACVMIALAIAVPLALLFVGAV